MKASQPLSLLTVHLTLQDSFSSFCRIVPPWRGFQVRMPFDLPITIIFPTAQCMSARQLVIQETHGMRNTDIISMLTVPSFIHHSWHISNASKRSQNANPTSKVLSQVVDQLQDPCRFAGHRTARSPKFGIGVACTIVSSERSEYKFS